MKKLLALLAIGLMLFVLGCPPKPATTDQGTPPEREVQQPADQNGDQVAPPPDEAATDDEAVTDDEDADEEDEDDGDEGAEEDDETDGGEGDESSAPTGGPDK